MGGNTNFNAQYFLTSIYGYFAFLQKVQHLELVIGCLVLTHKDQSLAGKCSTQQFSKQEERKPLVFSKEKID